MITALENMSTDASPTPVNGHDDESLSAGDGGGQDVAVESLVNGRDRRATAGNRLSSLLEKEGDDELELLFAENAEEEDVEFEEEEEDASDVEFDSSTDEENQAPAKGDDDDLAGEKELQRQDRLERQNKRKARDVFKTPGQMRKRFKIDVSATSTKPATKPKKKTERVSWVHAEADAPTRVSSRKQTVQNREVVHQRLVESEHTRLKVMQQMEEAQKRKDASKPKALTQADRLEEAAKTERRNAKSLNRWEESEKKRAEEQRARLEALHNRKLSGPVITWWSGLARWVDGRIGQLGVKVIRGAGHVEKPTAKDENASTHRNEKLSHDPLADFNDSDTAMPGVLHPHHLTEHFESMRPCNGQYTPSPQITFAPPQGPYGFLDGIHAYAAMTMHQNRSEFTGTADAASNFRHYPHNHPQPAPQVFYNSGPPEPRPIQDLAPEIEITSRTLIALKEIDANTAKLPEWQNGVLLKKPRAKIPSELALSKSVLAV